MESATNAHPPYRTFPSLSKIPGLAHGVFTRHGGVSRPPFDTLNVVFKDGDSREAVTENLRRVKAAMGLERMVSARQVHGDVVHIVDEARIARAESHSPVSVLPPGDALATDLAGVGLLIKVADCQPVFLVDPVKRIVANVHCGWRGSVVGILPKTVSVLKKRFGCRPEDLHAAIGPSLGPCCGEFVHYRRELPRELWDFQTKPDHFDFWAVSRKQLTDAGLKTHNIEIAGRCTVCETRDFFSYRGEKVTGRLATVVGWAG